MTIDGVKNPWLFSFFTEREDALKCVRGAIAEIAEVRAMNARGARPTHASSHQRYARAAFIIVLTPYAASSSYPVYRFGSLGRSEVIKTAFGTEATTKITTRFMKK